MGQPQEFRSATEEDLRAFDRGFYDSAAESLSRAGYVFLGDVANVTFQKLNGFPIVIRILASSDKGVCAWIYHFKPNFSIPGRESKESHTCCLCTEFDDGGILMTSNVQNSPVLLSPPEIIYKNYPKTTRIEDLNELHREQIEKMASEKPDRRMTSISTLQDALDLDHRYETKSKEYRENHGSLNPEQVRRMILENKGSDEEADLWSETIDEDNSRK